MGSVFFLFASCDYQNYDAAECDETDAGIEPDVEVIAGLRGGGFDGELLNLELPIEVADGLLKLVAHLERNAQSNIELDIGTGLESAEADPVLEGRLLIGRCVKEHGLAILPDSEIHLLEEFYRSLVSTEGTNIEQRLNIWKYN